VIAYGLIRGDGIHSFGSKMGSLVVASGMKAMSLYPMLAAGMTRTSGGLGKLSSKALLEPSIKELLQGENPDLKKMQELNKKGGLKNPLKPHRPLEDRLQELGLTKDEAMKLARLPSGTNDQNKNGSNSQRNQKSKNKENSREKNSFQFDPKYWNGITPEHREGIKRKYGITGDVPSRDLIHYPVNSGRLSKKASNPSMNERTPPARNRSENKRPRKRKDLNNELR